MTAKQWARLRQVGFATLDHAAAVRTATDLLALGPGFGDPLLAAMGLADFTAPVGPDTYLEVLAPTTPDHPVARWLRRVGGASGWVLSTQVPSLDGVKERAAAHGVRIAVETQAMGRNIVQLHPLDVGVLLELDEFLPREAWFWDELPAAQAAHAARTSQADDILAVDVAVAAGPAVDAAGPGAAEAPAAMARTWAAIIGLDPPMATADGAELAFGHRTIRFVPARDGRTGIVAVDVRATDRDHTARHIRRTMQHPDPLRLSSSGRGARRATAPTARSCRPAAARPRPRDHGPGGPGSRLRPPPRPRAASPPVDHPRRPARPR